MVLRGYTIEKQLGQGCMGPIYLAQHAHSEVQVVIRTVELGADEPEVAAMNKTLLQRHGRLWSGLRHPGVVPLREQFFEGQNHYFVFDYVEGTSLKDHKLPLPLIQVFQLADQLCAVLEYLHGHDPPVIVRDLKPSSLIVDKEGRLVVVDFGVSGIRNDQGEPGYAPAEQFGSIGTDARSDIYALGAVLYTLLTAEVPPWSVELASGKARLIPPATHRPLADVVQNMMAVRRSNRYPSVRDARLALAQIREVCLTSRPEDWEPVQPRPLAAVLALGLVQASLLGALGWVLYQKVKPLPPAPTPTPSATARPTGRSYADLLAHPEALGFTPSRAGYDSLFTLIRQAHLNEVTDVQMRQALLDEMANYLAQSGQDATPLAGLQRLSPVQAYATFEGLWPQPLAGYATFQGLLRSLNDPSATLLTPPEWQMVTEKSDLGGVGLVLEHGPVVLRALEGGPAERANIVPGDRIVAIDGKDTETMPFDVAVALIRGPIDSELTLKINHEGQLRDETLKRGEITAPMVSWQLLEGNIACITVAGFAGDTGTEFARILQTELPEVRAVVIDLRNTAGGEPAAVVEMLSALVPPDTLVYSTRDRRGKRLDYKTSRSTTVTPHTIICLINGYTAGCGELAAAALKEHKLARLVGQPTRGRGKVLQMFELEGGARVRLTVAQYLGPNGAPAEEVAPEVVTPAGQELARAQELLSE